MKISGVNGGPEELIKRCDPCDYCIFEDILSEEQRKLKVLDLPIPKNHVHRVTIEQICGQEYDEVCPMKYAAMRSLYDDFMAAQFGAVNIFIWDLGKEKRRKVNYDEALREWTKEQDFGRGKKESYAERFRNLWDLGLREEDSQVLTSRHIYEIVTQTSEVYGMELEVLDNLKKEFQKNSNG